MQLFIIDLTKILTNNQVFVQRKEWRGIVLILCSLYYCRTDLKFVIILGDTLE